jgi:ABC-type amino acid transport substrate-binding protein
MLRLIMCLRPRLAVWCLMLAASGASVAGPVLDRIQQTQSITLAHRESSIPFSFLDAENKPVGYSMDLCLRLVEAVRKHLRLPSIKVDYLPVTAATRIAAITEGRATFECGSTTNNAERRQSVAFTVPHYVAGARYLVRADSKVTDVRGFTGRTVVSTKGTTPLKAIDRVNRDQLLGMRIVEAPDHAAAVAMVEFGSAEAFVMDDVLLYGLIASRPDPGKLKVVGEFLTIEPLAIMLSLTDPELKRIAGDEMRRLIRSKEAHAIYERWFLQPIPPKGVPLNLPMNYLLKDSWKYPTDVVLF